MWDKIISILQDIFSLIVGYLSDKREEKNKIKKSQEEEIKFKKQSEVFKKGVGEKLKNLENEKDKQKNLEDIRNILS